MRSYSGKKLQNDLTCVGLRHMWPNEELPADVVDELADGSLLLELDSWRAITSRRSVGGDCVGERDVDPLLTWAIVVHFLVSL